MDLPRQNGWNVFGLVTAQNPLLPIIIITGLKNESDAQLVPRVSAFLQKPLDVLTLLDAMEQALAEPEEARMHRLTAHPVGHEPLQPLRPALGERCTPC